MKVDFFIPNYMASFKCIGPQCIDTCCAGWDINIDENTYNNYEKSKGNLYEIVNNKYKENASNKNFFNTGLMILQDNNICPFLNESKLCDIHGNLGEEYLCITCKSFPRIYNVVDGIYEKSGLPSCEEVCRLAFLSKEKMEFIELEEEISEEIEIRRLLNTDLLEEKNELLEYFWEIRVASINIMQNRDYKIHERLNALRKFYSSIDKYYEENSFEKIDKIIEMSEGEIIKWLFEGDQVDKVNIIKKKMLDDNLHNEIKSIYLKDYSEAYKKGIEKYKYDDFSEIYMNMEAYDYIFENYIVNQIFKDLVPFNKGPILSVSSKYLINSYKIIILYVTGICLSENHILSDELIIKVIQCFSKDAEHNKVFKEVLEM